MKVGMVRQVKVPDLLRQSPGGSGEWQGVHFTENLDEPLDALLVFNHVHKEVEVCCPRERVWCVMQEPYHPGMSEWMVEELDQFSHVISPHAPGRLPPHTTHHFTHGSLPWLVDKDYDFLAGMDPPQKNNDLSFISSNRAYLPGHRLRLQLMREMYEQERPECDFYGRGIHKIDDKWDALAPYRYSVVIENTITDHYWTEKLADSFLAFTLPFYCGCPNVETYFPPESLIRIDVGAPRETMAVIAAAIDRGEWERRLPALVEARRRVLEEHQLFPRLAKLLKQSYPSPAVAERFTLQAYTGTSQI